MPIFISRFSPDRSLVGNFLSTRTRREKESEPEKAPRQRDRLELSDRQQTAPTSETKRANAPDASPPVTDSKATETRNNGQSAAAKAPATLSISDSVQLRRKESSDSESSVGSIRPPQEAASSPLVLRLGEILGGAEPAGDVSVEESDNRNFLLSIQQENGSASRSATAERLGAFITRLDALTETDAGSSDEAAAERLADTSEVSALAPEPEPSLSNSVVVPQVEALPREIQEQELQKDIRAISSGLQGDAAIESRRNVEAAAENAQRGQSRGQRQEVRENQTEIRSLQSDRRHLQQNVQKTDQAIRQIQNRNSRLNNSSSSSAATGTSLDILAQ